jgi:hypothetical protein
MRYSLIFSFFIISSTFIYGQDNKLIYSKQIVNEAKSGEILQRNRAFIDVDFVEIDLEKIPKYEQFTLQFDEKTISVSKTRIDVRGDNSYCVVGKDSAGSQLVMSVLGDDIQGVIETPGGVFSIETIGKNDYAIIKIDQSKFREGCGDIIEEEDSHDWNVGNESMVNFPTEATGEQADLAQEKILAWDYPVKPGTEEWKKLESNEAMVVACQIPATVLQDISTSDLMNLCLQYPLLYDVFAFNNINAGLDKLFSDFNGIRELSQRKDALEILLDKYVDSQHFSIVATSTSKT